MRRPRATNFAAAERTYGINGRQAFGRMARATSEGHMERSAGLASSNSSIAFSTAATFIRRSGVKLEVVRNISGILRHAPFANGFSEMT